VAREKVGVTLEVWAYTKEVNGKEQQFGFVMAPWVKDPGGIPYGNIEEGLEVVERELRKAHREAAELRKRSVSPV
jgi:hypothetical protein